MDDSRHLANIVLILRNMLRRVSMGPRLNLLTDLPSLKVDAHSTSFSAARASM